MRMIPVVALAIPLFAVFSTVGLLDTLWALIITHTAAKLPVAIWLLMGFIQDLPKEVEEVSPGRWREYAADADSDHLAR